MSHRDRLKWDDKWATAAENSYQPHSLLTENMALLDVGLALDVACGRGQNAIWLAQRGYQVLGIDVSSVALALARESAQLSGVGERVLFAQMDLDGWRPVPGQYDLVIVFRFLDRSLFPHLSSALRKGGLLFYSTRHLGLLERQPDADPKHLLQRGELKSTFTRLTLLQYHEDEENSYLIARR